MKKAVILVALVLSALSLITVSAQAQVQPGVWAFLYSDVEEPKDGYKPPNRAGAEGSVTRTGEGRYRVDLAVAGTAGVPMVTATEKEGVHCQLAYFTPSGSIYVDCYRGASPVDSKFMLTFFSRPANEAAGTAYGYAHSSNSLLRYPQELAVAPPQDTRGIWTVRFFGSAFVNLGGNVQVTAVGTRPGRCEVVDWSPVGRDMVVGVKCRNLSNDPFFRPQWILAYTHQRSVVGGDSGFFGYLHANEPDRDDKYTPDPDRNVAPLGFSHSVTRSVVGRYQVEVHGPVTDKVVVHVSATGGTDTFCNVADFDVVPNDTNIAGTVDVTCYNSSGGLTNSKFTLNYYSPMT